MSGRVLERISGSNSVADSSTECSIDGITSDDSADDRRTDKGKIVDRINTQSAHGIKVPIDKKKSKQDDQAKTDKEKTVDRKQKGQAFVNLVKKYKNVKRFVKDRKQQITDFVRKYRDLKHFFDGTEQQVLYRVNLLINQEHTDLKSLEKDKDGNGILHYAVRHSFLTVAETLIDIEEDLILDKNLKDKTPLHLALDYESLTDKTQEFCQLTWCCCNKGNEDKEKKQLSLEERRKRDEMASLFISKMKPFRVRALFGDTTDFEGFKTKEQHDREQEKRKHRQKTNRRRSSSSSSSSSEDDSRTYRESQRREVYNTRYPRNSRCETTTTDRQPESDNAPNTSNNVNTEDNNTQLFHFIKIVMNKYLQKTTRTILDKLEDEEPKEKGRTVVYINILEGLEDTEKKKRPFNYIAKNCPGLTKHPVVRALIQWKWKEWAKRRYILNTLLYFLSFVALTVCSVVGAQSDDVFVYDSPWQYIRGTLEVVICFFIVKALALELKQFRSNPIEYIKSILNWVELSAALLLAITIVLRYAKVNAQWYTFSVGYVLWTVKGLKYAGVSRHTAAYAETLREIMIRDFWLFAVFFIAIEMVFGGTLLLVLKGADSLEVDTETSTIQGIYYVGLRTMIEGQMPVEYVNYPKIAQFVMIVFLVLTIVLMLNILIAQLSNTYATAYAEGQVKSWLSRAEAVASFDETFCICFKNEDKPKNCCLLCLFYTFGCSKEPDMEKLPFDKEKLLEEKEKEEEMRNTLKQLDGKLTQMDLTIHTVKTRLNVLLHTVQKKTRSLRNREEIEINSRQDYLRESSNSTQADLSRDVRDMKSDLKEIKSLLKHLAPK